MSRLWSRIAVRIVAVLMLALGVAGGLYLGGEPDGRRGMDDAGRVGYGFLDASVRYRAAEQEARNKAAEEAKSAALRARAAEDAARRNQGSRYVGATPTSCAVYQGNRAVGCNLLLAWGFGLDQMPCLDRLWTKESGWSTTAGNRSTGAYGIPQALPGSKMAKYGDDWPTNPETQIKWGLDYIKGRYGTPCGAWSSFLSRGWY